MSDPRSKPNYWPAVSIVTPSLNQKEFLPHAIESVLRQDYPNLEYIVMDGGSTDGSLNVLKSYGDRLRWISEPDTGQSNAVNKGFRMARGEIVAWLNADDILLAGAVRKAAAAFSQDPDLAMIYGEGYILDQEGHVKGRFPYTEPFNLWRLIHVGDSILQQTVFMRKAALEEVGYLDESLHWGMDWDLFIRLGKRFRVQYLNEYLGCIREYGTTKTSTGGGRRFRELVSIIRRHAGRRFAPAYFAYGLDTYYSLFSRRCGRASKRLLDKVHAAAGRPAWLYMQDSQGWFPDGWAAPVAHFALPNLRRPMQLEIEGSLPQLSPEPVEQNLTIQINGRKLCERRLPLGRFLVSEAVPDWASGAEMLRVDLLASRVLCERGYPERPDPRQLCYLLERVQVT